MQLSLFLKKHRAFRGTDEWLRDLRVQVERRPWQRTLSVRIKTNGVVKVTCSRGCSERVIHNFLLKNKKWIEDSLDNFEQVRSKYPAKKFESGEKFLFQGRDLTLKIKSTKNKNSKFSLSENILICHRSEFASSEVLRESLLKFYRKQGQEVLTKMVEIYSKQMELYPKRISFRSQKTRWGSCSSEGHITLNWRLIAAPPEKAAYVVIHELAHLKHQNHSKSFWNLVEKFTPEWKIHRKWLNENQFEFDFLAKNSELHI